MAISFSLLGNAGDTSNVATYTTSTLSPGANKVVYLAILANAPSGQVTSAPALSGIAGLTWEQTRQTPGTDSLKTLYWYRANTGSTAPTPGAITMSFAAALTGVVWAAFQVDGADLNATSMQSVEERRQGSNNSSVSFPFTSPITAGNAAVAAICTNKDDATIVPGTGWTALGPTALHTAPTQNMQIIYSLSPVPTNIEASWATATANTWVIGVEVPAGSAGPVNLDKVRVGSTVAGIRVGSITPSGLYVGSNKVWP